MFSFLNFLIILNLFISFSIWKRGRNPQHWYPNHRHPRPDINSIHMMIVFDALNASDWLNSSHIDDRISRWIRFVIEQHWMHWQPLLLQQQPPHAMLSMCPLDFQISSYPDCTWDVWICNGCVNCRYGCRWLGTMDIQSGPENVHDNDFVYGWPLFRIICSDVNCIRRIDVRRWAACARPLSL